jgi:NAD(P)-dependent dehydrogenase (short-subunit alcohol dehydrogenase family)
MTSKPLEGRTALVTGASRGIGYASALGLAKAGAHVIATARTQGGLEALDDEILKATGARATLVPMALEGASIDQLGRAVYDRWGKLDILASVAGDLGTVTPVAHLEPQAWERAVAVNMTANYRLIRSFDPLLRLADAGRAIFVTSGIVRNLHSFWGSYAATKAGLEALVQIYADEVAHTQIRCALLNPGPMRTRMRNLAFPGEDPEDLPPPEAIAPLVVELARGDKEPPAGVVEFSAWTAAGGALSAS